MTAPQIISLGLGTPSSIGWFITLGLGDFGEIFQAYRDIQRSLNPIDFGGNPDVYLEIHGFTDNAGAPIQAHLYNVTDSSIVSGSEISSGVLITTRLRSGAFNLAVGTKTYEVRYGGISGHAYTMEDAALIIDTVP